MLLSDLTPTDIIYDKYDHHHTNQYDLKKIYQNDFGIQLFDEVGFQSVNMEIPLGSYGGIIIDNKPKGKLMFESKEKRSVFIIPIYNQYPVIGIEVDNMNEGVSWNLDENKKFEKTDKISFMYGYF